MKKIEALTIMQKWISPLFFPHTLKHVSCRHTHVHTKPTLPQMDRILPEFPVTLHLLFLHFIFLLLDPESHQRKALLFVLISCKFMARNYPK